MRVKIPWHFISVFRSSNGCGLTCLDIPACFHFSPAQNMRIFTCLKEKSLSGFYYTPSEIQ